MDELERPVAIKPMPPDAPPRPGLEKITCLEDLQVVLAAKRAMPVIKLGVLLVELGLLRRKQLGIALQVQEANSRKRLGEIFVELGYLTREELDLVLCQKLGIPLIDLSKFTLDSRVVKVLSEELVRNSAIVPLCDIEGASDIHVEANHGRENVVIRFRNDGQLSESLRLPYYFRGATISRLKIMAGLDISERRRSQDGRINFNDFGSTP